MEEAGLTHHKFEGNLGSSKIVKELNVPFSSDEIATLESLRTIREGWSSEALRGSGLIRELYMDLVRIPWATKLLHRDEALSDIRGTIGDIRDVREKYGAGSDYAMVAEGLSQIENGLLQFVPDMKVEEKK